MPLASSWPCARCGCKAISFAQHLDGAAVRSSDDGDAMLSAAVRSARDVVAAGVPVGVCRRDVADACSVHLDIVGEVLPYLRSLIGVQCTLRHIYGDGADVVIGERRPVSCARG